MSKKVKKIADKEYEADIKEILKKIQEDEIQEIREILKKLPEDERSEDGLVTYAEKNVR